MKQLVFSVRDVKAESFGILFTCPSVGIAVRGFMETCSAPNNQLSAYPADFQLFQLGSFDVVSGEFVALSPCKLIVTGSEAVQQMRAYKAQLEADREKSEPSLPLKDGVKNV